MSEEAPSVANLMADSSPRPTLAPVMRMVLPAKDVLGSSGGFRACHQNNDMLLPAFIFSSGSFTMIAGRRMENMQTKIEGESNCVGYEI
jgi:hypothetical protein